MKKHLAFILFLGFLMATNVMFAQPANDDCGGAVSLTIAADEASAIPVSGTTIGATGSGAATNSPINVCSGSWFGDDVWYSFTTGATVPADGYTIKLTNGSVTTFGMAIYTGCGTGDVPFYCFSDNSGLRKEAVIKGMTANTTYSIRVWSGGSPTANSGTFQLYPNPAKDNVTITSNEFIDSYDIFDLTGKLIKSASQLQLSECSVDTSAFSKGVYLIQVTTQHSTITKRLLIN